MATKDVASDGDCLFHALAYELRDLPFAVLRTVGLPLDVTGPQLREWMRRYIQTSRELLQGLPLRAWLEQPLEASTTMLRDPRRSSVSWGGVIEVTFIMHALRRQNVSCLFLATDPVSESVFRVMHWVTVGERDPTRVLTICWTGAHYKRARMWPRDLQDLSEQLEASRQA